MFDLKHIASAIVVAVILAIGGAVASNDREISGIKAKLEAVHEDVKIIKELILEKGVD